MTRDDFVGLPASMLAAVLWDSFPGLAEKLKDKPPPRRVLPPKYDAAIYRKEGIQWASESDAESLRYWRMRYLEGASKPGNQYAEKDAKRAESMERWIAWRLDEPHAPWSGERNRQRVTALPPSARPKLHEKKARDPHEPTGEPVDDSVEDFSEDDGQF